MRILTNARRAGMAGAVAALALTVVVVARGPRMPEVGLDQPTGELAEAGAGGSHEGIKVHGHWAIEVRNPDGSLVEQREFENALEQSGANYLARWLSRQIGGGGYWTVFLAGSNGLCQTPIGTWNSCNILEPENPHNQGYPYQFPNLGMTESASGNGIFMSGTAVAQRDGSIAKVATGNSGQSGSLFSSADIPPINVLAGQSILVTVTLSFS